LYLICSSDWHLRTDNPVARSGYIAAQETKLYWMWDYADTLDGEVVILQAGDICDSSRSWALLPYVYDLLITSPVKIFTVFGQHDLHMYSDKLKYQTVLGILGMSGVVKVLDNKPLSVNPFTEENVDLYGCSIGQNVPEVIDKDALNVLVIHRMIVDKKLWSSQENCIYAPDFLKTYKDFDLVVCGDAHRKYIFKDFESSRYILNTGVLVRGKAEEYMFAHKPGFYLYDTVKRKANWVEIPHDPAYEVLDKSHLFDGEKETEDFNKLVEGLKELWEQRKDASAVSPLVVLNRLLEEKKIKKPIKEILARITGE